MAPATLVSRWSIPACAGETGFASAAPRPPTVHPRVCGGNGSESTESTWGMGPSPRVRGKRILKEAERLAGGSIPACAGETLRHAVAPPSGLVHPRVCGGKPSTKARSPAPSGSIPACAGETRSRSRWCSGSTVHPRVCGGNRACRWQTCSDTGPSPRVRGKPLPARQRARERWSIPACAGGNSGQVTLRTVDRGPSPRVRGKLPADGGARP